MNTSSVFWKGQAVEELTREQLIEALTIAAELYSSALERINEMHKKLHNKSGMARPGF